MYLYYFSYEFQLQRFLKLQTQQQQFADTSCPHMYKFCCVFVICTVGVPETLYSHTMQASHLQHQYLCLLHVGQATAEHTWRICAHVSCQLPTACVNRIKFDAVYLSSYLLSSYKQGAVDSMCTGASPEREWVPASLLIMPSNTR